MKQLVSATLLIAAGFMSLQAGDQKPAAPAWKSLFDGKTLKGWKSTNFGGEAEVTVEDGTIVMDRGSNMTGITFMAMELAAKRSHFLEKNQPRPRPGCPAELARPD